MLCRTPTQCRQFPGTAHRALPAASWGYPSRSDFFNAARLAPGQVDAEFLGSAEDVLVGVAHLDRGAVAREHLHVQAERLHLLDQHLERLRDAWLRDVLALDDRLIDLDPAEHVVGLDRQQLLQGVGGAIRLQRPYLHLAESLAAELRLSAEWLLGDHGVRPGGASMDLVIDKVQQLEDVDVADRYRILERLAGTAVEQPGLTAGTNQLLAIPVRQRAAEQAGDLLLARSVEDRRRHRSTGDGGVRASLAQPLLPLRVVAVNLPAGLSDPAKVRLEYLADVHTAGHTERVEHDVHRRAVLEERHVLDREDLGDDALVAVPPGQLVPIGDLALLRDVDPDQLVDPRGQLVAVLPGEHADPDDLAGFTVRHLERGVSDLARLLSEDRAQQPLFRGQLGLAIGRDLADQDVAVDHLGTDPDDAALVEVGEDLLGHVGDIPGDL